MSHMHVWIFIINRSLLLLTHCVWSNMDKQEDFGDGGTRRVTLIKFWDLNYFQSVCADKRGVADAVHFIHDKRRANMNYAVKRVEEGRQLAPLTIAASLTLTGSQFFNLNDIILNWSDYERIENIPIGKHVWLYNKRQMKHLYNSYTRKYFTFFYQSWLQYKRTVHYLALHFLRRQSPALTYCHYGKSKHRRGRKIRHADSANRLQDHKYLENLPAVAYNRSRNVTQIHTGREILPCTSKNACSTFNKRAKYSTIPERENTSSGRNFGFRRAANEIRVTNKHINPISAENEQTASREESTSPGPPPAVEIFSPDTSSFNGMDDIKPCCID